jgi:hypothetical protein
MDFTPHAQGILSTVNHTEASVAAANGAAAASINMSAAPDQVFTLKEVDVPASQPIPKVLMWGYTPWEERTGATGSGAAPDGNASQGIPLEDLYKFLVNIAGIDFKELGLIDDDGQDTDVADAISNIINITIGDIYGEDPKIVIETADGQTISAEATLGQAYLDFLSSVLFDENGHSRLYLGSRSDLFDYPDGSGSFPGSDSNPAIVLAPWQNNGGTVEPGFTGDGDDFIVAGRLELLHGAYIDGGAGYDTLEIDAKGIYAQPLQLLGIEEINIEQLPNVYNTAPWVWEGSGSGEPPDYVRDVFDVFSDYPDIGDPDGWDDIDNSVIDISRATSLEKLVISAGWNTYPHDDWYEEDYSNDLTIVGIRNGVTAEIEGGWAAGSDTDLFLHYRDGVGDGVNIKLSNLDGGYGFTLNVAHNSDTLNIESAGGGNWLYDGWLGGSLSNLNITGSAGLYIESDLDSSFHDWNPVTIDASGNSGGVNLTLNNSQDLTFLGSTGADLLTAYNAGWDEEDGSGDWWWGDQDWDSNSSVTITDAAGDGYYDILTYKADITTGDGDDIFDVWAVVANIAGGEGDNRFDIITSSATLTAGDGDNIFEVGGPYSPDTGYLYDTLDYPSSIEIVVGDGQNRIEVASPEYLYLLDSEVSLTAGDGGNSVAVRAADIAVSTGAGADVVNVWGAALDVATGAGDDEITIAGWDPDYVATPQGYPLSDGALLTIDTGSGADRLILGDTQTWINPDNDFDVSDNPGSSVTAMEGSSITGEDITLVVNVTSDLRAAALSGITKVILDDDSAGYPGQGSDIQATTTESVSDVRLTLTAEQFKAIGAANFGVEGSTFGADADIELIITENTSLSDLNVAQLDKAINLYLVINDGVTLRMTAQELAVHVAPYGVSQGERENNDLPAGKVVITNAGLDFDPWNTTDPSSDSDYANGSLSADFATHNVTVRRSPNGWDRPEDDPNSDVLVIDSTGTATLVQGGFSTWVSDLSIVGNQDVQFTGAVNMGEAFNVDFSTLEGEVLNFVLADFQDVSSLSGNGWQGYDAVVYAKMKATLDDPKTTDKDESEAAVVGSDVDGDGEYQGLVSTGVKKLIVTDIDDGDRSIYDTDESATIYLCDDTVDLEVIGLRGNWNATLNILQVQWGIDFELQGDGTVNYTTKANGDPAYSNIGTFVAEFQWEGASAVVNINNQGTALTTRSLYVNGVEINNADAITINVADGNAVIHYVGGDDVETLVVNSEDNVAIVDAMPSALTSIDVSGVLGTFSGGFDPADDFSFTGAAGGSELTLGGSFTATDATEIDGGAVGVELTIADSATIELSAASLTNVTAIVLEYSATLELTVAQMDAIGAANFSLAAGADHATLNLFGLDGEPFALANFADGINVNVMTIAALPVVTLHPDTDLTGIDSLVVPEGTVLNLTAAQFQQLETGGITGVDGTTKFTVNITDLMQADVKSGFDLSGITADNLTVTLAESVKISAPSATVDASDFNGADIDLGTFKLTLYDVELTDGLKISGGAGSTLEFTDTTGFMVRTDASGFDFEILRLPALLVSGINVDYLFEGLPGSVTKVIYNGIGDVEGKEQEVVVEARTTILGDISFNDYRLDLEVTKLTLDLQGGTEITGDLVISTVNPNPGDVELIPYYLQELVINSTGTGANKITGETANIIAGDITPAAYGPAIGVGSRDNNLKEVTINADQDLVVKGEILFSSHGSDNAPPLNNQPADGISANDDDSADALLTINGSADVTIGAVNTSDDDIDSLTVQNNGTGTVSLTLDAAKIDQAPDNTDDLSFLGGNIELTVVGNVNLSDDDLSGVSQITIGNGTSGGTLTLSLAQLNALGVANLLDGTNTTGDAVLNLVGLDSAPFDVSALDDGITVATVTLVPGNTTLNAATNLTGVGQIIVPEGSTLNLTAAQFQQLSGTGSIVGLDVDGDETIDPFNVNITDLRQADVTFDANGDGDTKDPGDTLDLSGIVGAVVNVSLGEPTVTLGTFASDGTLLSEADLNGASVTLADNQTLRLVSSEQADGLDISGGTNTTLVFLFDNTGLPVWATSEPSMPLATMWTPCAPSTPSWAGGMSSTSSSTSQATSPWWCTNRRTNSASCPRPTVSWSSNRRSPCRASWSSTTGRMTARCARCR